MSIGLCMALVLIGPRGQAQTLAPAKSGEPPITNGTDVPAGQQMPDFLKSALEGVKARAAAQGGAKPAPARDPICDLAIGTWRGLGLEAIKLDPNGTAQTRTRRGAWICLDPGQRRIAIDLAGSARLTLFLDAQGMRAKAQDPNRKLLAAYKEPPEKARPTTAPIPGKASGCAAIAGHWLWTDGAKVTLNADGRMLSDRGLGGIWQCQDAATNRIGVTFQGQAELSLTFDAKAGRLEGKDAAGWPLSIGRRP